MATPERGRWLAVVLAAAVPACAPLPEGRRVEPATAPAAVVVTVAAAAPEPPPEVVESPEPATASALGGPIPFWAAGRNSDEDAWARDAATEQDRAEAKRAFLEGRAAFDQDDFAAALEHFVRSHTLYPAHALKPNIAVCLEKLGRKQDAIDAWRWFVRSDPPEKYEQAVAAAQERLIELGAGPVERPARPAAVVEPPIPGSARDEARTAFREGLARFSDGRYGEAREAFARARASHPTAITLLWLALSERALGNPLRACELYQHYQTETGDAAERSRGLDGLCSP